MGADVEGLEDFRNRARLARGGMWLNVAIHAAGTLGAVVQGFVYRDGGASLPAWVHELDEKFFALYNYATWGGLLLGGFTFLRWTSRAFGVGGAIAASKRLVPFPGRSVAVAFFIPLVNLFKPFKAFSVLNEEVDPADLPEPAPRPDPSDAKRGYRDAAALELPARIATPPAPVGTWWAFWVSRLFVILALRVMFRDQDGVNAILVSSLASTSLDLCAAVACVLVIDRITARILERARRLTHAPDSEARRG
jgi:hypothetical protein